MTPENLEWLHQSLELFGQRIKDEWARNEALTIILQENGVSNVEERVQQVLLSHALTEKAHEQFRPWLERLEKDMKAAWIEEESKNPPPKVPPSRVV